jgi:hypothetical protein
MNKYTEYFLLEAYSEREQCVKRIKELKCQLNKIQSSLEMEMITLGKIDTFIKNRQGE